MKRMLTVLWIVLLGATPAAAQATIGGEWRDDVDRFVERVIEADLAPGISFAVSKGEWVLYAGGAGVADGTTGRPASADSAFYIASTSKALTATAVVLRASRGEIDLDAPVTRYVPGLEFRDPLDADSVTIERLLTMTHGIDDGGPVVVRTAFTGQFTPELLVELLADYGPSDDPNVFDYGNLGYNILGLALDPHDGHGWKRVVSERVLAPLGMRSTSAWLSRLDPESIALPHEMATDGGWERIRLAKDDANLHAAGGHFTTAHDMIRFVAAHASDGRLEGERVFPAAAIASTHEPHVEQSRRFGPFERFAWGYGWDLARWRELTIVQRFGSFSGYRSHVSFEPVSGVGVVVLTNGDGVASPAADLVATYVYDRLLGREDLEAEYESRLSELRAAAEEGRKETAAHRAERAARLAPLGHPLEAFAGTYENRKLGSMVWQVVAGGLESRIGVAGSRAEIYDASEDQLRIDVAGGIVADFEFPEGGGPATAVVIAGERFERVGS